MLSEYFQTLEPRSRLRTADELIKARPQIEAALRELGPKEWYSRAEVMKGTGIYTEPGMVEFNGRNFFAYLGVTNLSGLRILDIGAFTGAMSFYCEDEGAEVVSIDVIDPATTGYALLHEIRGSQATHVMASVYDLDERFGLFDLVIFSGIHYHLRHPLLGIERINGAMKDGAVLLTVGTVSAAKGGHAEFYPDKYLGDRSNWFVPTTQCLEDWLKSCGFAVEFSNTVALDNRSATSIRARKIGQPASEFDSDVYFNLRHQKFPTTSLFDPVPKS